MDLKKEFGFDQDLAESGQWISVDGNGTRIKVAAMPNPAYERWLEPHQRRARTLGREIGEAAYEEAMAETVLLDWENVEDGGLAVKATKENRLAMLRKYRNFKALVIREATNISNFRAACDEAELKN